MNKFVAYDDSSIYAIGETPAAAIAKAREDTQEPEARFDTAQISDELAAQIERDGWDGHVNSFDIRHGMLVDTTAQ